MWSSFKFGNLGISVFPPRDGALPQGFSEQLENPAAYATRLADIQRFRGRIYSQDGAIPLEALDEEGRHRSESDHCYWHVTISDSAGAIYGCLRLRHVKPSIDLTELEVYRIFARMEPISCRRYLDVMEQHRHQAQAASLGFGEVGGFALTDELRQSSAALMLIISGCVIKRALGGMITVGAATVRHHSAKMLQRIGAIPFRGVDGPLAPFYDLYYRCEIQMLTFDSRKLAPEFEPLAEQLRLRLLLQQKSPTSKE